MTRNGARCLAIVAAAGGLLGIALAGRALAERTFSSRVELTLVDREAINFATFESYNQKVVCNRHGIFITHLRTRDERYMAQTWRLSRSTDGGRTFVAVYEAVHPTNPPVLETDPTGNVYLARPDFADGNAYLYLFLADKDFKSPAISKIPGGSAGKFAMVLDRQRQQLDYFAHNNTLHILGLDGRVIRSLDLIRPGKNAALQYPLLALDHEGRLHAAWTTQKHDKYLYWDIHHMVSSDAGQSWHRLDGQKLDLPVVADDTGPSLRISLDDEFDCHTWLSSFLVKQGKVHFLYLAQRQPPRVHYMRYDVATGRRELDRQPQFGGETIQLYGLDGFFASRGDRPDSPLYCLGCDHGRVACLVSRDNGQTWHDYARSEQAFQLYSLGGCREISPDGYILGTFTDSSGKADLADRTSKVYFLKIKAE